MAEQRILLAMTTRTRIVAGILLLLLLSRIARAADDPLDIPKPSKGISLGPESDRVGLTINARVQPRYVLEHEAHVDHQSFQIRRARIKFKGHLFGQKNRFYVQLGFSPADMVGGLVSEEGSPRRVPLRDARLEFNHLSWARVWLGQMKVPFSRERLVSDANLDMIDRSLLNREFNMDRDIGVQVRAEEVAGFLGYSLGVFSGQGRNVIETTSPAISITARLQFDLFGSLDWSTEGDLQRTPTPAASLGLAYAYHGHAPGDQGVHGARPSDGGTTDLEEIAVDFVLKAHGLALEAAAIGRTGIRHPGTVTAALAVPRNGWGTMLQLGWLLPKTHLEIVGRCSGIVPLVVHGEPTSLQPAWEATAGMNYYLGGHDLKIEFDFTRSWEAATEPGSVADSSMARLQFQTAI